MAVQGENVAAFIDYLGLELLIPENTSELGFSVALTVVGAGVYSKAILKGKKALFIAAKRLGIDPKRASMVLHQIKRAAGRGGADNAWIDASNGDVIAPETLEVIGNLFDFP